MSIIPESELREPSGLNDSERELIKAFMQGAVYCWVKNQPNKSFEVRDLVGGINSNWSRTPLQILYDRHIASEKDENEAYDQAAKDIGWIVKTILSEDRRTFKVDNSGRVNSYTMIAEEV